MTIEKSYNVWASQYDSNDNKTRDLDSIATTETLSKYSFDHVLELGCGTGKNTEWLSGRCQSIVGLDFSEEMLNVARTKVCDDRVEFIQSDINEVWSVADESVNLVTASLTLEHIEDLNHVFDQAYLKLKAEGMFFISELHPYKQYKGSKARFETDEGIVELEVYIHHITDYTECAQSKGFELLEIKEWFDEASAGVPRLISFVFKKKIEYQSR